MAIDPVSLAITVALNAAMMAVTMSQKIEGPRTADLTATVADYGTPLNNFYGKRRLEVPAFYAEGIREEKIKRKTKGGKYNEYVYYGTWAVAIAEHEIEAVSRVWFDRHLVYDASNKGPTSVSGILVGAFDPEKSSSTRLSGNMYRLYYGTEDQLPDPRIEQKIDGDEGVGSTPAYRGLAYIIFEDVPLEKFGNRYTQVSVEAIRQSDVIYPVSSYAATIGNARLWNTQFSPDFSRMLITAGNLGSAYEIWDLATQTIVSSGSFPTDQSLGSGAFGKQDGTWRVSSGPSFDTIITTISADGSRVVRDTLLGTGVSQYNVDVQTLSDGYGNEHYGTISWSSNKKFYFDGVLYDPEVWLTGSQADSFFVDLYGDIWACLVKVGTHSTVGFKRMVNVSRRGSGLLLTTLPTALGAGLHQLTAVHYKDADVDHFVVAVNYDYLMAVDIETGTATLDNQSLTLDVYSTQKQFNLFPRGYSTIWLGGGLGAKEISLKTLEVVRSTFFTDWEEPGGSTDLDGCLYDPINNALMTWNQFGGTIMWRYLDRPGTAVVLLSSIVADVSEKVGLDTGDYDASALNQNIDGYSWTMGTASDIVAPLLELYDSDVRPHDAGIEFIQRGGAASVTLARENMARSSDASPVVKTSLIPDVDLPFRIFLNFADLDADQTPNTAVAQRGAESISSSSELPIDMTTLALSVDGADALAKRAMRVRWFERSVHELDLTPLDLALEPGDLRNVEVSGDVFSARLLKMDIAASGKIDTKWVNTEATIHTLLSGNGASLSGRAASVILVPGLSEGFVIDGALTNDADEQSSPLLYVAASAYDPTSFYPGTEIARSEAGDDLDAYNLAWDGVGATESVTWGIVQTALPDAVPFVWDRGSILTVDFKGGVPATYTEDEIQADQGINLCAIGTHETGWEYVQFATATLISGTIYEITNILRGIRGTEQFMDTHIDGERMVFISPLTRVHSVGISELGSENYYRAVTQGRQLSSAIPFSFTFTAAAHKPYAPTQVKAVRDSGTGDWEITWLRRTRIGGSLIDGQDVPLGETSESYKIEFVDYDEVIATKTATGENYSYTAAEQATDFGSSQLDLTVRVRQVAPDLSLDGYYSEVTA